jgi:hypothetical protein
MEFARSDLGALLHAISLGQALDQGLCSMFDDVLRDALVRATACLDDLEDAFAAGGAPKVIDSGRWTSGLGVYLDRAELLPIKRVTAGKFRVTWREVPSRLIPALRAAAQEATVTGPPERISGLYYWGFFPTASGEVCLVADVGLVKERTGTPEGWLEAVGFALKEGLTEALDRASNRALRLRYDLTLASKRDAALFEALSNVEGLIGRLDHARDQLLQRRDVPEDVAGDAQPQEPGGTYSVRLGVSERWLMGVALTVLPAAHRDRYREEFSRELLDLQKPARVRYAWRQVFAAWALRRALAGPGIHR